MVRIRVRSSIIDALDQHPQYQTCLGLCHVRTASVSVGVFEILIILSYFLGWKTRLGETLVWFILANFFSVEAELLVVFAMIVGASAGRRLFMAPYLLFRVMSLIRVCFLFIAFMIDHLVPGEATKADIEEAGFRHFAFIEGNLGLILILLGMQVWSLKVINSCYHYHKEREFILAVSSVAQDLFYGLNLFFKNLFK